MIRSPWKAVAATEGAGNSKIEGEVMAACFKSSSVISGLFLLSTSPGKAESHKCRYRWGGRMEIGNNTKRDQRDHPRANAGAVELNWAVAQRKPSGEIVERNTYQGSDRHQHRGRRNS